MITLNTPNDTIHHFALIPQPRYGVINTERKFADANRTRIDIVIRKWLDALARRPGHYSYTTIRCKVSALYPESCARGGAAAGPPGDKASQMLRYTCTLCARDKKFRPLTFMPPPPRGRGSPLAIFACNEKLSRLKFRGCLCVCSIETTRSGCSIIFLVLSSLNSEQG